MTAPTAPPTDALDTVEVLADPLRRQIVRQLATEELCTCHLVELTGAPQPTVSYHLKVLRDAGWVTSEPAGRYTYYALEPEAVSVLVEALGGLEAQVTAGVGRRPACDPPQAPSMPMSGAFDVVAAPDQPAGDACCAPDAPPRVADVALDDQQVAALAKAIAHPARVRILRLLEARRECITGDLVDELQFAQSTVSGHLRVLREAGLVQGVIEGPRTRYCVNAEGLRALRRAITSL